MNKGIDVMCCNVLYVDAAHVAAPVAATSALRLLDADLLQCVAVCYSVLQCVAVCCSMLQCVAVRGSALQCVALCCSVLHLNAVPVASRFTCSS